MKKTFCYLTVLFISLGAFNGCKKMDSTYKQFIVPGGITYAGKANSAMAYAGRNRVKISWLKGADPNITKARIFWNNYNDSVEVNIPPTRDTNSVIIDNLPEKTYSFMIKTYDVKGYSSIPVEIFGGSYGQRYQAQLLNRFVKSSVIDNTGKISIQWGTADISTGAIATEVKYTNAAGMSHIQKFEITDSESQILDIMPGTTFQYRTLYVPKALSIDTFYTSYVEQTLFFLNKSQWKVKAFSTQHSGAANLASNVIDGNPATRWHTQATTSRYPHFVTVDMGIERTVTNFEIFRMKGDERACDTFQLLVSSNNITWTNLGVFNFDRLIDDAQLYEIPSRPKARYFKFVGLSGPQNYMVTGEINVYGL